MNPPVPDKVNTSMPTNGDVAAIFERIADILEIQGENPFKIKAYRNAVETLRAMDEPVSRVADENRLTTIPGFGEAIREKIVDILGTGTTNLYERIKDAVPPGVVDMLTLPGIGGKTVRQLWEGLKVENIDQLREALDDGRVAKLPGMGEKTAQKIRQAIEKGSRHYHGFRIDQALAIAENIIAALDDRPEVEMLTYSGALRRGADVVDLIILVGISTEPPATIDAVAALPQVAGTSPLPSDEASRGVAARKSTRATLHNGATVDITVTDAKDYAALLFETTGTQEHISRVRELAAGRGVDLPTATASEQEIYAAAGLPLIPATIRENTGEIEAAQRNSLPRLLTRDDYKGDVHAHTTATDGTASIEEMAEAARVRGYQYMAITDHSYSLAMVGGLTPDRLRAQIAEIRALEDRLGIRVFAGSEVDIKADGSLDFDDDLLAELDIVIASSHLYNNQTREAQTKRMIRAIENPHVDLIAHPTGRLINRRDPYEVDIDALIAAAARTQTALEINAAPERLDLKDEYARRAAEGGVKIMINTDAHRTVEYDLIQYGITCAQRAWLTPADVLNTLPLAEFEAWLKR